MSPVAVGEVLSGVRAAPGSTGRERPTPGPVQPHQPRDPSGAGVIDGDERSRLRRPAEGGEPCTVEAPVGEEAVEVAAPDTAVGAQSSIGQSSARPPAVGDLEPVVNPLGVPHVDFVPLWLASRGPGHPAGGSGDARRHLVGFLLTPKSGLRREEGQAGRLVHTSLHLLRVTDRAAEDLVAPADADHRRPSGCRVPDLIRHTPLTLSLQVGRYDAVPVRGRMLARCDCREGESGIQTSARYRAGRRCPAGSSVSPRAFR